MTKIGVDLNNLPNSRHFDIDKTITLPSSVVLNRGTENNQSKTGPAVVAPATPSLSPTEALLFAVFGHMLGMAPPQAPSLRISDPVPGFPEFPHLAPSQPATRLVTNSPAESSHVRLPYRITLNEFCMHYTISDADKVKLLKLEVELGNQRCENLDEDTWKQDGGFSHLGWERFTVKHTRFCADVQAG